MKKILFAFVAGAFAFGGMNAAFADEVDSIIEEIIDTEIAAPEEGIESGEIDIVAEESSSVVKRTVASEEKKEIDKSDAAARRAATKGSVLSRASDQSVYNASRIAAIMAPPRSAALAAPVAPVAPKAVEPAPDLECIDGEFPKGTKCEKCAQRNNPAVLWANPGKDCKIAECVGVSGDSEYALVDEDKDEPTCQKKCEVWGGMASRAWDGEQFGFCGSGKHIECDEGFRRTNEKTSTSEIEFWHCVPRGTLMGSCKNKGGIQTCEFPNGRGLQSCENGFWSNCIISRTCAAGFIEGNHRETFSVAHKKEQKTGTWDCVPKKK